MRIFILPGTLIYDNMGDVAMLQVAVQRLKSLWPDASLLVLSGNAEKLKRHCPEVEAVSWTGCKRWLKVQSLPRVLFPNIRTEIRDEFPLRARRLPALLRLGIPANLRPARHFVKALLDADLVVASGCGLLTDDFKINAARWLDMFAIAARCNIPAVMLGQGLGPIQDRELLESFARTVPRVDAVFIRENQASRNLLKQIHLPEEKIFATGDDAVELAFNERRATDGKRIGVNLRIARYAKLDEKILESFRHLLAEKARQYQTTLTGIPILQRPEASDVQTLQRLVGIENAGAELDTPLKVIRQVADCRIVVAGSYHAGVFALSQGIPVVAIIQSAYYRDKFQGLAGQFGCGCIVLSADDAAFTKKLRAAMDELRAQAETLKPRLLAAAERQIQSARAAYAHLPALFQNQISSP